MSHIIAVVFVSSEIRQLPTSQFIRVFPRVLSRSSCMVLVMNEGVLPRFVFECDTRDKFKKVLTFSTDLAASQNFVVDVGYVGQKKW